MISQVDSGLRRFAATAAFVIAAAVAPLPALANDLTDGAAAYKAGDYAKAERLLKPLALAGDAEAEYLMGKGCDLWIWPGSKQTGCNYQWYSQAAARGHVEANAALGRLFRRGSTEPLNAPLVMNRPEAVRRLIWAANRGSVAAQMDLADYYHNEGAEPGRALDTDAASNSYYWALVAAATLKAHPDYAADPDLQQSIGSLVLTTEAERLKLTDYGELTVDFTAFVFMPEPGRTYPEPVKATAPDVKTKPEEQAGSHAAFKLDDAFDYFAKTPEPPAK